MEPKPLAGKGHRILSSLVPILIAMTAISTIYLFKWKKEYGRLAREKKGRTLALPVLERTRELLTRAEMYSRFPDPDEHRITEVRSLLEEAAHSASEALERIPESEEAFRLRGRALELLYEFGEATQDYLEALKHHPESPARYHLGMLGTRILARAKLADLKTTLLPLDKLQWDASEPLRRYRAPAPEFKIEIDHKFRALGTLMNAYAYGDYDEVPTNAEAARAWDSTEWIIPYIEGLAALELKNPRAAAAALERAVRLMPAMADPHAALGLALQRLGRPTEALQELSLAILADSRFLEAYFLRGTLRHQEGLFENAREDFKVCAQLRDSLPEIQLKLGGASFEHWDRSGRTAAADLDVAETALTKYLNAVPKDAAALLLRARTRIGRKEPDKAEQDLVAATALLPDSAEPHEVLASLHESREKWELAEREYGLVMDRAPGTPRAAAAQLGRARLRARAGRADDALSDYDALLARDPSDTFFLEKSAVQAGAGRSDDALATVDRALSLNPRNARVITRRAEILLEKGQTEAAIDEATRAYRADPQQAESLVVRGKAFLKKGLKAEAAADWKDALRLRRDLEPVLRPLLESAER